MLQDCPKLHIRAETYLRPFRLQMPQKVAKLMNGTEWNQSRGASFNFSFAQILSAKKGL